MKGGPKSSLRPFLHRALQLLINTFASVLIIFHVDKYIRDKQNSDT